MWKAPSLGRGRGPGLELRESGGCPGDLGKRTHNARGGSHEKVQRGGGLGPGAPSSPRFSAQERSHQPHGESPGGSHSSPPPTPPRLHHPLNPGLKGGDQCSQGQKVLRWAEPGGLGAEGEPPSRARGEQGVAPTPPQSGALGAPLPILFTPTAGPPLLPSGASLVTVRPTHHRVPVAVRQGVGSWGWLMRPRPKARTALPHLPR